MEKTDISKKNLNLFFSISVKAHVNSVGKKKKKNQTYRYTGIQKGRKNGLINGQMDRRTDKLKSSI